nr:hypothetical protein [Tanacetum cinerariifolium]
NAQLQAMIDQGVKAALAARDANRTVMTAIHRERVSGGLNAMEMVFRISNCLAENQVNFATCTLLAGALTWWNSHVRIVGNDAAYVMTWIELKKKMADKVERYIGGLPVSIHGSVAASKPKTMQEATEMATGLMDKKIRTYAERKAANKRKFEDTSRNNQGRQQPPKRQDVAQGHFKKLLVMSAGHKDISKGINPDANTITGTFLLNNCYASVLFDTGADRSFVSTAFSSQFDIAPTVLDHDYAVELADGRIVGVNTCRVAGKRTYTMSDWGCFGLEHPGGIVGNKMLKSFPLPVMKIPLLEYFATASEEVFPLLILEFGDSYEAPPEESGTGSASESSAKKKGRTIAITTEDMQKRRNDVKARTTLLLALPDERQLRFSKYETAQELWGTILKTFGGNEATKKTKKNQLKQYGKGEVNTASIPTASTQVSPASVDVAATGKKITIVGFDKSKVECLNFHKMGHFARECRAPRSEDMGRREIYKQGSKEEELAPKARMAIDGVGWDWCYMANEEENMLTPIVVNRTHMNVAQPIRTSFSKSAHSYVRSPFQRKLAVRTLRVPRVSTINTKFPTIDSKFSTTKSTFTAGLGIKGKAVKALACWIWRPKQNTTKKGLNCNGGNSHNNIDDKGYWDNGCSWHMTGNLSYLSDYKPYNGGYVSFRQGGGKITGKGIIKTGKLEFENVYFVKDLKYNLFSVSQIYDNKNSVLFTDSECIVLGRDFKLKADTNVLLRTPRQHNMYYIDLNNNVPHKDQTSLVTKASADESMLWHRKLGHLNFKTMNKLVRHNLVKCLPSKSFENDHTCVACLKGKQHKASCKTKLVNSMSKPLHTLHMDLFGPTFFSSLNHKWYCLVVTDDFSRFTWTFFLKTKDETSGILRNFITEIENLKELKVKIIRCDNGGEFKNKEMNEFCTRKGIKREFSNARTPQQNRVAERRNRTLIEVARTMLADAKLLVTFWAEAVNIACYVQNRVLENKSQNKTTYELFNNRTPTIGFLKPFGCHVMILNNLDHLRKFDAKGDEVVVIEKSSTNISGTKDAASQAVKKDVSSLRYIALPNWFHEEHLESSNNDAQDACNADAPKSSGISNPTATSKNPSADQMESLIVESAILTVSSPVPTACLDDSPETSSDTKLISKGVTSQDETLSLDNISTLSNRFEDILGVTTNTIDTNGVEADLSNMESIIPSSPTPTLRIHKDHPKSQIIGPVDTLVQTRHKSKEMEEHSFIATIHQKTTPGVRPIDTKWVLKNKKDERGIVIRNKARLVAQGHTQEKGIDYEEVFAPVARIEVIGLFLAYASFMGFTVYQMDVKSAFLYGTIDEEVYVMQPPRFQDPQFPNRVYKVEKAMYGLHHSPRAWYGTLSKYLLANGFQRGTIDQPLFIRKHRGDFLLVQVYVDDIILGSSNPQLCREFEALMHDKFQMSAMGELNFFLGLQVLQKKDGIFLSQDKYVGDILKKFRYSDVRSMIGSLMYLTASRPDIMFVVHACARHQVTPKECHLHAVKRIFRYLKGHPKLGLLAFCDYHNIIAILEKSEHNVDFHQLVDFVEASHIRYALAINPTVYVSHIRQFWSTVRIKTTNEGTKILATVDEIPTLRQYSRRATRIAQSKALPTAVDEPASLLRDDSQGKAFPTVTSLDVGQDKENIIKTSALPYDLTPRVTSLDADEGSMQQQLQELTDLCTCLRRQKTEMATKIEAQDLEISSMRQELSFLKTKKKKVQNLAREMEEEMAREDQRLNEQITRDAKIARIHAEEELQMMIDGLDRNNEVIAKHLQEYEQSQAELTIREKIKLINEQVKYQDHHAKILKYQAQQSKPLSKKNKGNSICQSSEVILDGKPNISERKGLKLEQESAKRMKTLEDVFEEDIKEIMQLVPVEEVYVEALQVKHLIIDWEIHSEGQRDYWKTIRLGGHTAVYQFFVDM